MLFTPKPGSVLNGGFDVVKAIILVSIHNHDGQQEFIRLISAWSISLRETFGTVFHFDISITPRRCHRHQLLPVPPHQKKEMSRLRAGAQMELTRASPIAGAQCAMPRETVLPLVVRVKSRYATLMS
jgi:hypothetical protein